MWEYRLAGWKVESDFPYDGLPVYEVGPEPQSEEQTIRLQRGPVPDLAAPERTFYILPDGAIFYAVTGFFRCLVSGGTTITVEVVNQDRLGDVPGFLLGCIFGALCHQRGELIFHAGCVEINGRAVVVSGPSGAGKSTFMAAFMQRGFRILSDDVIMVRTTPEPTAVPTVARCKLWHDSVTALTITPDRQLAQRSKQTKDGPLKKFECLAGDLFCSEPRKIDRMIHLLPPGHAESGHALSPILASDMLWNTIYQRDVATALGGAPNLFKQCVTLSAAIPHVLWSAVADLSQLSANIDALLSMIGGDHP